MQDCQSFVHDKGKDDTNIIFTCHSTQELIDYAYKCCVFRELTPEERQLFGLPER